MAAKIWYLKNVRFYWATLYIQRCYLVILVVVIHHIYYVTLQTEQEKLNQIFVIFIHKHYMYPRCDILDVKHICFEKTTVFVASNAIAYHFRFFVVSVLLPLVMILLLLSSFCNY